MKTGAEVTFNRKGSTYLLYISLLHDKQVHMVTAHIKHRFLLNPFSYMPPIWSGGVKKSLQDSL